MSKTSLSTDNIWHPFTQMKTAGEPVHIVKGSNCTLFAADGTTYIDAVSSWWVNIHGHCNKKIARAIAKQANTLEHVIFAGFTHTPAIDLANTLTKMLPSNLKKVFFSDDGSTSVEVALKMAIQYWHNLGFKNKTKLIAFENAYHGDTFGAMSAAGRNEFNAAFNNFLFDVHHIPIPTKDNIDLVTQQFLQLAEGDNVAAFIFEPLIQGAAGMQMYEAVYLDQLMALAAEKNIICIADEVMTGFGRTGKKFAIDHLQNKPDIICLSKGITGGFMPLGVTVSSLNIYNAFYADDITKTFFHGHSYTANPLACAAANASMAILQSKKCQRQIKVICESHQIFAAHLTINPLVKNVRQRGTIIAFELNTKEESSYFNSIKNAAYNYYLSQGVFLRPMGNVVYILPPYCITADELQKIYEVILKSLPFLLQ